MASQKKSLSGKTLTVAIPVVIVLAVCGLMIFISSYSSNRKEPLTAGQILSKKDWTKDELADTITRMALKMSVDGGKGQKEVYAHLQKNLEKLPEKEREEVVVSSIRGSIVKGLELMRTMEPEKRKNIMEEARKEAEKNRKAAEGLSKDDKSRAKQEIKDVYMKAVDDTLVNKATPEERREMAPIVREWVATLESLE